MSATDSPTRTNKRASDCALSVRGDGTLDFRSGAFMMDGNISVEGGCLCVSTRARLSARVIVQAAGNLRLLGQLTGAAMNSGSMLVWDDVRGDVINDGILTPGSSMRGQRIPARIAGNFNQTRNGTLEWVLGAIAGGSLAVTGRADVAGTLQLVQYWEPDHARVPMPAVPISVQVLHADGGIFGQFDQWTAPGLSVEGNVRYLANDVYFDITALSTTPVPAALVVR